MKDDFIECVNRVTKIKFNTHKDKRIKEDGKACHGGTSLSRFS